MRKFTDSTRLDTTDPVNYPNGQLKDATTPTAKDGTLINKTLLADIRTVFTRALKLTGVVPNGNFDTENSSQLFDACFGTTKVPITTFYNGFGQVDIGNTAYQQLSVYKENGGRNLRICGWIMNGAQTDGPLDMFLLPVGYRPTKTAEFTLMANDQYLVSCRIDLDGTISQRNSVVTNYSGYINASIPID